jgi:hypothetical protein
LQMTKQPFGKYTPTQNGGRSIEEACAEIQREMDVRRRLFDRWVQDGKISWMDAHDRMERHMSALKWLIILSKRIDEETRLVNNPPAPPVPFPQQGDEFEEQHCSENGLDVAAQTA